MVLDNLRCSSYSSEEMLFELDKIHTNLHKHEFYFYWTDFDMKRGDSACAATSFNADKIACQLIML